MARSARRTGGSATGLSATGAIGPDNAPPHNFPRRAIEEAIDAEGFQLWRLKKTEAEA